MNIIERVVNSYTAFTGNNRATNSASSDPNSFLKYGNRHKRLLQDWSQVEMSDEDMYTGYSYAAIKKRANRASVLGRRFLYTEAAPKLMEAAKAKDDQVKHPYLDLITKSKEFTQKKFWHDISTYLDLEGVYYLMAVRAVGVNADGTAKIGAVQKFVMLNPYNVKRVRKEATGEIGGYIESRDGMYREIPKEQIIEIRLLNPFNNDIPFSMTDAAKENQFTMKQAGDFTRHSIQGNINAPGVITTDVILEDHIFDNFIARIKNHDKGEPIYGNGAGAIKWEDMQIDLDKAALDKINEIHRSMLFAVTGVSKTAMGIEESGTGREVSKTQKDDFTENAVMPQIEEIIDALNLDYRKWYPEWDTNEYEIMLDNPLEADRDAELKDIDIREKEYEMTNKLINLGYEFDMAAAYAHGDISLEELGEPTLEEELSDQDAEQIAAREMGIDNIDSEPQDGNEVDGMDATGQSGGGFNRFRATREDEEYEMVRNKFVKPEDNEKKLKAARKRVKDRLKAQKDADRAAKAAEKEAKKAEKESKKTAKEQPTVNPDDEQEEEEVKPTVIVKVETPNNVVDRLKAANQIAARDFPDLYDGMGIDMDKLGCIMIDTESIPVLQYVKNPDADLYRETNYDQSPVPGETQAHVTLLFGLLENGNVWKDKVNQLLVGWSLPTVTIEKVSYFDLGDSYAIVGLVEKSDELVDGHERLTLLPHINTFSEYHPHITLAYINHDEALLDKWIAPLAKKYNGQKVATTGINYGDLPEDEETDNSLEAAQSVKTPKNHIEDEHDMSKNEKACVCCNGSGEHATGFECYRCDASGQENDAEGPMPCDGREDSPNIKQLSDGTYEHASNAPKTNVELPTSHDCSEHGFVPNSNLEKAENALDPEVRDNVMLTEANLQDAVARLEGQALDKVLAALRNGDIDEIEKVVEQAEQEQGGVLGELVITLAAFYTVLFPVYASQLMALRLAEYGVQGVFNMSQDIEKYIKEAAQRSAESHLRTVIEDFVRTTDSAAEEVQTQKLVDLVMEKVKANDANTLALLPDNPDRKDVERAVNKGKFDKDPAYALARKYAREGAGLNEIEKALRDRYQDMTQTRAKTIARHESSRVFTMSQFEADKQFLDESGLGAKAYKRLRSRTGHPCAVCASLIAATRLHPIPFHKNFADLGDILTATYKKDNGKMAVQKVAINYEAIKSGNVHVNCNCEYELIIKRDDGSFFNDLRFTVDNKKGDRYNPYRDKDGKFASGPGGGVSAKLSRLAVRKRAETKINSMSKYQDVLSVKIDEIAKNLGTTGKMGKIKIADRVTEKSINDYAGDVDSVKDIVRGTLMMDDPDHLQDYLKEIKKNFKIDRIKDGYASNEKGYKDVKVNVEFAPNHVGEIILITPEMQNAKSHPTVYKISGHQIYKLYRSSSDPAEQEKYAKQTLKIYEQAEISMHERLGKD